MFLCKYSIARSELIYKNGFEFDLFPLNDTGITWSGNNSGGNNETCISSTISSQDCNEGRDADASTNNDTDGLAGFSFTKLDESGNELPFIAINWSCVRDNVTGLVWEIKNENPNSIHYINNTYKWGGITAYGRNHPIASGPYFDDWNTLVNDTNSENLCGSNNWKVPNINELNSIINLGVKEPALDTNYFPFITKSFQFWTSNPSISSESHSHSIYFNTGSVRYVGRQNEISVMLVHSK